LTGSKELGYLAYNDFIIIIIIIIEIIGVPDRGAGRAVAPLGFEKLVKFGQMRWEIRAFRGLNFCR